MTDHNEPPEHPAFDGDSGPSFAELVMDRSVLDLPDVAQYARAAIIARRVMSVEQNKEFVAAMLDMAEGQAIAHWEVLGEPAGPGDIAFETCTRALWLNEILLQPEVGDAFEAILPEDISGPLFAELRDRGDAA